jgi:hypothetical protein
MPVAARRSRSVHGRVPATLAAAAALLLTACGGKGGNGYSISVDHASLSFAADQGGPLPAPVNLAVGFNGEGLLAGWPADAAPPSWLDLLEVSRSPSSAVIRVSVTTTSLAPGTYTATVRLVTGKADGSAYVVRDVPVTFVVTAAFTVTGNRSVTITQAAATADLDLPLTVKTYLSGAAGTACSWQLGSSAPWLTVAPSTGTLASDTPIVAHLDPEALWTMANGPHTASLTFTLGQGCGHSAGAPVAISLNLDLRPALTTSGSVAFDITEAYTPADTHATVTVASNLGTAFGAHAGWSARLGDTWVTLAPVAGTGSDTLDLDLAPATIGSLAAGDHATTLSVVPADAKVAGRSVAVTLRLDIPTVAHVSPYTTWVNRPSPIVIRGGAFGAGPTRTITVGAATIDVTVVSSTELHATVPAQASPGRLAVRVESPVPRGGAELVVLPEPAYAATSMVVPSAFPKVTFDPERQALLFAETSGTGIVRVRWDGAAWTTDHVQIGQAQGSALSVGGDALLVVAGGTNNDLHRVVTLDPETLASRSTAGFLDYYSDYTFVAPFDDGRVLLAETNQWSTFRWYPTFDTGPYALASGPTLVLTRDRRRLLVRPDAYNPLLTLDSTDTSFKTRSWAGASSYRMTWGVSGDGERMFDGLDLYDRSFTKLGSITLAAPAPTASGISPDGAFVYTLQKPSTAWELRRTAVSASAGPYAPDATPLAFVLPPDQVPQLLQVSEDGSTLFILAYYQAMYGSAVYWLHVVPLP